MLAMSATVLAIVALAPEMPRNATAPLLISEQEILVIENLPIGEPMPPKVFKLKPLGPLRAVTGGPVIALTKPANGAEVPKNRVEISLVFTKTSAEIDLKSLEIYVYVLFGWRLITDEVVKHSGVKLSASGLTTPPFSFPRTGNWEFRVALSDVKGNKSEREFEVTFVEPD